MVESWAYPDKVSKCRCMIKIHKSLISLENPSITIKGSLLTICTTNLIMIYLVKERLQFQTSSQMIPCVQECQPLIKRITHCLLCNRSWLVNTSKIIKLFSQEMISCYKAKHHSFLHKNSNRLIHTRNAKNSYKDNLLLSKWDKT